ncbi:MAG: glyceraldehyde 3-phosphate dehydrogenase NAD-binding domain-containing protein, partial [Acidimicrobiales bacterium]
MAIRVGINGFGRIGRNFFRAAKLSGAKIEFVAVNDLGSLETLAHLLKNDSVHGKFGGSVKAVRGGISVDGQKLAVLSERNPGDLPWGDLGVDVVIESTGIFADKEKAQPHIEAGAKKVIISAPASCDATFVVGVNDDDYDPRFLNIMSSSEGADLKRKFFKNTTGDYLMQKCKNLEQYNKQMFMEFIKLGSVLIDLAT